MRFLIRYPIIAKIFSLFGFLGFGYFFVVTAHEYQALPNAPVETPLEEAIAGLEPKAHWVTVTNPSWNCEASPPPREDSADAVMSGTGKKIVVASFSSAIRCEDIPEGALTGTIKRMSAKRKKWLTKNGLPMLADKKSGPAYSFCTYCGKGNTVTGIIVSGLLALSSLTVYPLILVMRRKMYGANSVKP